MTYLSPPAYQRIRRATNLDLFICGSQGNVACNIARLGLHTAFMTKVPDNDLGLLMKDHYMSCGVDVSYIKTATNSRLGVNFIEFGATPRASKVIYDRKNSAASTITNNDYNWPEALKGARLAYTDGIFPGLSESCRDAAFKFVHRAYELNVATHLALAYNQRIELPLNPQQADDNVKEWLHNK